MDKENLELQQTLTKELHNRPSIITSRRNSIPVEYFNVNNATEDIEIEQPKIAVEPSTTKLTITQSSQKSDELQESNAVKVNDIDNMIFDIISSPSHELLNTDPSLTEVTLTKSNLVTYALKAEIFHDIYDSTEAVNLTTSNAINNNDEYETKENSPVIDMASFKVDEIPVLKDSSSGESSFKTPDSSTNDNTKDNVPVISDFSKVSKVNCGSSAGIIETTLLVMPIEVSSLREHEFGEIQNPAIDDIKRESKENCMLTMNNDPFKKEPTNHSKNTNQSNTKADFGVNIVLSKESKSHKNRVSTATTGTISLEIDTSSHAMPTTIGNLNTSNSENDGMVIRSKVKYEDKNSSTVNEETISIAVNASSSKNYINNNENDMNIIKTRSKVKSSEVLKTKPSNSSFSTIFTTSKSQKNGALSQRGQKRKHTDSRISTEETILASRSNIDTRIGSRYEMRSKEKRDRNTQNLQISDEMKVKLIDDWEWITTQYQLVPLPKSRTVENILDDFYQYKKKFDPKSSRDDPQKNGDPLWQDLEGLKIYFNEALEARLLYRAERAQLYEFKEENVGVECSTYYGAEHLLRLLVNIREEKAFELKELCEELIR
ncbi:2594_t:CDS:2 [Ambispora leptoticha]|uniref:2594_t:CDS:1 n=1 Tax=Ambispora leptoticha TaxID=144679 RepID=A0A9N8VQW2_9GLOM|nr:2594_t:CDS:2 [Ambispora leptoticha]